MQAPGLTRYQKQQIAVKYLRLKNDWVRMADMKEDLGINMQGPVTSLKLDGMLDYKNSRELTITIRCGGCVVRSNTFLNFLTTFI